MSVLFRNTTTSLVNYKYLRCFISSSPSINSKYTVKLTNKFFLKTDKKKRRKKWQDGCFGLSPTIPYQGTNTNTNDDKGVMMGTSRPNKGVMGGTSRPNHRTNHLSKVFLDRITDIMSTGEISTQLSGLGMEIAEVRVLPNIQGINIYWICTSLEASDRIQEVLENYAFPLRHILSQQRIIGHVPIITFVKDDRYRKAQEVERLLALADYGEDFVACDPVHNFYVSTVSHTLSDNIKKEIYALEGDTKDVFEEVFQECSSDHITFTDTEPSQDLPSATPSIRHDVLGVHTDKIYRRLQQCMKQSRGEHRLSLSESPGDPFNIIHDPTLPDQEPTRPSDIREWARNINFQVNVPPALYTPQSSTTPQSHHKGYKYEHEFVVLPG
ncbi:hypothetical protein Pmani_006178 [Petrolisthes manimaculis]|uniref:Ribosome-binding factor A n=1 Tax=Petrolisthes manimaculis TaxID=1843537 RepID=A0AAE1ULE2_9EUCA|nr:hypothetical protein Pmani_006178 [Petrolisthes manimaculis]